MSAQKYLSQLLWGILPNPQALRVEEETVGAVVVLTIRLAPQYRRFVVGKRGRNMEAIRDLLRAYGGRHGMTIVIKLSEESIPNKDKDEREEECRNR